MGSRNSSIWVYTVLRYVLSDEESEPLRSGLSSTVSGTISGSSEQKQDLFSEFYYLTLNSSKSLPILNLINAEILFCHLSELVLSAVEVRGKKD